MMSETRSRMIRDMVRKMDADVEAVMQRNVDIARHVFDNIEVTGMAMRVAASVTSAAILIAIQTRRPETDPVELYDIVAAAIAKEVAARRQNLPEMVAVLDQLRGKHK